MDFVRFHKTVETQTTITNAQFEHMHLSPFLNPIEKILSKCNKHGKRENSDNERGLMNLIETGSSLITSEEIEDYIRNIIIYYYVC
ncbi:hypothetical protein HZS_1511 [Henneguya salminicola]|nr:hypothetical protein HZS_1511 [Henneguya salminicola]